MKKKIVGVSFLVLILSLLYSCSSESNNSDDKTTVDIFNIKVETAKELEELAEVYEENNPEVEINVTTVGGGEDADAALQSKFSSGDDPSIFLMSGLSTVERYKDKLAEVSDLESVELAVDGTLEGVELDDEIYGVPMNVEGFSWLINKDLFQKAGVNPDDISSYDEFVEAVETLDSKKEELDMDAVFGFSAKENWVVSQYSAHFTAPEFDNNLQEVYEAETVEYEYGERMKEYTDLINEYNEQPILSLDYSTAVEEKFMNEKLAIIHQGNWIVPTLDEMDPDFAQEKLDILPFYVENDTEGRIAAGPPWYWGVNKTEDDAVVEESKDFLDWLYTSDEGKRYITEEFDYIPAHENFDSDAIGDPVSRKIYEELEKENTDVWAHNSHPEGWYSDSLFPEFQKYLDEQISWDEFESETQKSFEEMRKQ